MDENSQKIALTETVKAEEKKVMVKRPVAKSKKPAPKPNRSKSPAVAKPSKKAAAAKKAEKKQAEKKHPKDKVVRDSFTMPNNEYGILAELKKKCLAEGVSVKKSELLRAGLQSLAAMSPATLKNQLAKLKEIKVGRPAKA